MAARDKYGKEIDVAQRLTEDGNEKESSRNIAALFGDSVFHSGGIVKEDGLESEEPCADFESDSPQKVEKALNKQIKKA